MIVHGVKHARCFLGALALAAFSYWGSGFCGLWVGQFCLTTVGFSEVRVSSSFLHEDVGVGGFLDVSMPGKGLMVGGLDPPVLNL